MLLSLVISSPCQPYLSWPSMTIYTKLFTPSLAEIESQNSRFVLDLEQDVHRSSEKEIQLTKDSLSPKVISLPAGSPAQPSELSVVAAALVKRLKSDYSSDRASALTDLVRTGGIDGFKLITRAFDDRAAEVRNAAARALYDLHSDRAGSFTRALREASPERRRRIGAAIAGSGLATVAINSLAGGSREKTYDAFSTLFLMAKSGEVQPLMNAIAKHPDIDVRLTAIRLLSLSNQAQVLPAFRSMATHDPLPPEVHAAVMEAMYQISGSQMHA